MDDLRRRFASLDGMPAPDLWDDVERRAAGSESARGVGPVPAVRPTWTDGPTRSLALLLAVAGLIIALVAGALLAGSGDVRLPAVVPLPSPATDASPDASPGPSLGPSEVASTGLVIYTEQERYRDAPDCDARPWRCFRSRLMVAGADGTGARPLLPDEPSFGFLGWSPDGTQVLGEDEFGNIRLAAMDGSPSRHVGSYDTLCTPRCTSLGDFAFSPDGTRLAFAAGRSPESGDTSVIAVLDLESGAVTELASTATENATMSCETADNQGVDEAPRWSPDGTRIAFARQAIGPRDGDGYCGSTIYLVDAAGTDLRQLVPTTLHALNPRWSPDGGWIAFHTADLLPSTGPSDAIETLTDIFLMRPDGSDLRPLTTGGASAWPSWTRDGRISFVRWLDPQARDYEIWVMNADGSDGSRLEDTSLAGLAAIGCVECPYRTGPDQTRAYWQPTP